MSTEVYECHRGARESVNADHIETWPVDSGQAYLVCDGIDHNPHTSAVVRLFCDNLIDADWSLTDDPKSQLNNNIVQAIPHLPTEEKAVAFCLGIAIVREDTVLIGHCGDCRVGRFMGNGVEWLTEDDVIFLDMYRSGQLTREQYLQCRNMPSCKLKTGTTNMHNIKIRTVPKPPSGHLLLCSDGFWAEKEESLTGTQEQCLQVVKQAIPELYHEAQDNFSIIVV